MGSTRFPGKCLTPVRGRPLIKWIFDRLARAKRLDEVVLATTNDPADHELARFAQSCGIPVYRGSDFNVLRRYIDAANWRHANYLVRITGDCPLVDPWLVDQVVETLIHSQLDYVSNIQPPSFPDGLDIEAFTRTALQRSEALAKESSDFEHVTPVLRQHEKFSRCGIGVSGSHAHLRMTVDYPEDIKRIEFVLKAFGDRCDFGWKEISSLLENDAVATTFMSSHLRNEGCCMNTGEKLWERAKRVIPGGGHLLSKRPEMFTFSGWPCYFSKAKGCTIWDLDGREFRDVSVMGLGTNTLGYGHPKVDEAVHNAIQQGNLSTLYCPEEVMLAERLVSMHTWADQARFSRSGGEAVSIAIRIARAASGKDKIAFCGYHGWHDWYLSANLGDFSNLNQHLLPGLKPGGVPSQLRSTALPFEYNNIASLQKVVSENSDLGTVVMEVERDTPPTPGFLQAVREITSRNKIVLIFDECTSGFRSTFGGLHLAYGVDPDMAIFGKALGNGYAITAVIGREAVMDSANETFISSTFWTERIGFAAALASLEAMQSVRSWEIITTLGREIKNKWQELIVSHGLPFRVHGLDAFPKFALSGSDPIRMKTFITEQMLSDGFLAANSIYVCTEHLPDIMDAYFVALNNTFRKLADFQNGMHLDELQNIRPCNTGFARMT